jgi:hypothetical protein
MIKNVLRILPFGSGAILFSITKLLILYYIYVINRISYEQGTPLEEAGRGMGYTITIFTPLCDTSY